MSYGVPLLTVIVLSAAELCSCVELYNFTGQQELGSAVSSERINLSNPFVLDTRMFSSLYVNQDGAISFGEPVNYEPVLDTLAKLGRRTSVIAPFWSDIDLAVTGNVFHRNLETNDTNFIRFRNEITALHGPYFPTDVVMATWENVGHYDRGSIGNSFQAILGTDGTVSFVMLRYKTVNWTVPDPRPNSTARPAVTGIASGRSLFYIVSNLLTSSFYMNNPGVFVYRMDLPLAQGADNIRALCLEGDIRLSVGQNNDYFLTDSNYDSSFFVGGMEGGGLLRGRVEYCNSGIYKAICYDDSWDARDASVVCRQLGFAPHGAVAVSIEFVDSSYLDLDLSGTPFYLHSVMCSGSEDSISQCSFINTSEQVCQSNLPASVICQELSFMAGNCADGAIRLIGGEDNSTGRLEVCFNNAWGSVCRNHFGTLDAQVACHQLGFLRYGATPIFRENLQFGTAVGPIFLDYLACTGSEEAIVNCSYVTGPLDCDHSMDDVGVQCLDDNQCSRNKGGCEQMCTNKLPGFECSCETGYELDNDGLSCNDTNECLESRCSQGCINTNGSYFCQCEDNYILHNKSLCRPCEDGEVRLVGGAQSNEGRVEVCYNSVFHTICDDFWDEPEARVVCRQLGYDLSLEVAAVGGAYFGAGSVNRSILLDDLTCNGSEVSLLMCPSANSSVVQLYSHNCNHQEDAGVICNVSSCVNGDIRLEVSATSMPLIGQRSSDDQTMFGKNGIRAGRVDICVNGTVGTVCSTEWDNQDASVVCTQLGYSPYGALATDADVFNEGSTIRDVLMSINCTGNESRLLDCKTESFNGVNCPASAVICQDPNIPREECTSGELRLEGGGGLMSGNLSLQGRVELCLNNAWGTVCNSRFGSEELQVVCTQITGVTHDVGAAILPTSSYIHGSGAIFLSDLNCNGNEDTLVDCPRRFNIPLGLVMSCDHTQDVGVLCPDIDECHTRNGGCFQMCSNFAGSYNCSCREGYLLGSDGLNCTDIDECQKGLDQCHDNATCENIEGNYTCTCNMGFSGNGLDCTNVNECATMNDCDMNAVCNDTIGNFTCTCNDGYTGNGFSCTDINECQEDLNICGSNTNCANTMGNFTCSCLPGFEGSGVNCTDTDECLQEDPCPSNAICNNTIPFFTCECRPGYRDNGFNCTDIDECQESPHSCDVHATCSNTNGSFDCTCLPGYTEQETDNCSCKNGDVLLKNGSEVSNKEGRVEICYKNEYLSVCDDLWDAQDAQVVCRQLNFTGTFHFAVQRADRIYGSGQQDQGDILLDNIQCVGNESTLLQCAHNGVLQHDCATDHSEDAGVVCGVECDGQAVRLVNPDPDMRNVVKDGLLAGRVEMCLNGRFRTICDDFWTNQEASLLCKELGFSEFGAVGLRGGIFERTNMTAPGFVAVNCTGRETWSNCSRLESIGQLRCEDTSVVCQDLGTVSFSNCEDGDVRLVDGSNILEGRLEVCVNHVWGTVCSRGFGTEDAKVVCRKLGFASDTGAFNISINSEFSPGVDPIFLEYVGCNGDEADLLSCTREQPLGLARCPHSDDVGLVCPDKNECAGLNSCAAVEEGGVCINRAGGYSCACRSGYEGDGTSCNDIDECTLSNNGCQVGTCVNNGGSFSCNCTLHNQSPSPGVGCEDIDECSVGSHNCKAELEEVCNNTVGGFECVCPEGFHRANKSSMCLDADECMVESFPCGSGGLCRNTIGGFRCYCQPGFMQRGSFCECEDQQVRLVDGIITQNGTVVSLLNVSGGNTMFCQYRITAASETDSFEETCDTTWSSVLEGRVEICVNNEYLSVCDDRWDVLEARVICRQLQYPSTGTDIVAVRRSRFGNGRESFVLDDLNCRGTENSLFACPKNTLNSKTCSPDESAGVRCGALCEDYEVRILVGEGESYYAGGASSLSSDLNYIDDALSVGRIEVCFKGSWRALCSSDWTKQDASVVCQQLGFAAAGAINGKEDFRDSTGKLPLNLMLDCRGNESHVRDCRGAMSGAVSTCQASDNAYVICQASTTIRSCTHGELRLVGGPNIRQGRLEICVNKAWGSVCSSGFFDEDAAVACAQMNFEREGAIYIGEAGSSFQSLTSPIFLRNLQCTGTEDKLLDCDASPLGTHDEGCSHENDVVIRCQAFCPAMTTFSSYGTYSWSRTPAGTVVTPPCLYDGLDPGQGLVSRSCSERGNWELPDISNCSTRSAFILNQITSETVGVSNVANILEMLQSAVLTNTTEVDQTSSSMAIIESTLASIAGCSTCSSINTTEDVLAVLSSVSRWTASGLNPPTDISVSMNIEKTITNLAPPELEKLLIVSSPGIIYSRLRTNATTYASSNLAYRTLADPTGFTEGSISNSTNEQGGNSIGSIMLPGEVFARFNNEVLDIVLGVYENSSLFPRGQAGTMQIASSIVSATIANRVVNNLTDYVSITMTLESEDYRAPVCMFWNDIKGEWSNEGCLNVTSTDFVDRSVTCKCNHLTTFAVMVNVEPANCSEGFASKFDATTCEAIEPVITFTSSRLLEPQTDEIRIGSGQELNILCTSSGQFPGRAVWRKRNEGRSDLVEEINATDTKLFNFTSYTFSSDLNEYELNLLKDEQLGQVYAYRINDTRVVLGTRRADVFGAAIGIGEIANGTYECFGENSNTNTTKLLHLNVIGQSSSIQTKYVRFTTESIAVIAKSYYVYSPTTQPDEFVLEIIGTAVLNSLSGSMDTLVVSINCTTVPGSALELMKNWTRIGCLLTSTNSSLNALNVNQTELLESIPRLPLASAFIEERGIAESDNGFCDYDLSFVSPDNRGVYNWNETEVGQTDMQVCFFEPLNEDGFASRGCDSHQMWNAYNGTMCVTENTYRLRILSRVTVTVDNADNVVQNVSVLLSNFSISEQREDNFVLIADIYENIGLLITNDEFNVTNNLTGDTVSILNSVSIWPADSVRDESSNLIMSYEEITSNLVTRETFTNVQFQERDISVRADLIRDISILIPDRDIEDSYIQFGRPNGSVTQSSTDLVSIVEIPQNIFESSNSLVYSLYESPNLFQVVPPTNDSEIDVEVDTMVVGFTLLDKENNPDMQNLSDPVVLTFKSIRAETGMNFSYPLCVSWDFEAIELGNDSFRGNWTTSGCTLNERRSNIRAGLFVCECSHLTNFAVLVNINAMPSESLVSQVISIIGSVMSIVGLALTIFLLLFFKNIRTRIITKFHIQLCLALLLMYLVFVIGIQRTENEGVCSFMSVLIQYFALTSVFWMGAEAMLMLKNLVIDVFGETTSKFTIITSITCWVVPALFPLLNVIISLATKNNYMITRRPSSNSINYCFMSDIRVHIPLFLFPIYSIIFFNLIAFVLIVRVLILQKIRRAKKSKNEADVSANLKTVASISSIMIVYGIFWLLGVLNVSDAAVYFMWPFLVLNVFQGVLIFVFIGVFNTYKEWINLVAKRKRVLKTTSTSNPSYNVNGSKGNGTKETSFHVSALHDSVVKPDDFDSSSCKDTQESSEPNLIISESQNGDCDFSGNADNGDLVIELKPESSLSSDHKTDFD